MNLDERLTDTLHDDRWALPVPADTLSAVRRGRRHRRQRTAVLSAAGSVAVVAGAALLIGNLGGTPHDRVISYAASPGQPEPGITPAFVPTSGRDWLLTAAQANAYNASHTHPSPPPGQSTVASPAPLTSQSADLLAAVDPVLPGTATMTREDSVGGQPGVAAVHVHLADGTPVEVSDQQLAEPFAFAGSESIGNDQVQDTPGASLVDVPGTTSAAGLVPGAGYGFPGRSDGANEVVVATAGGLATYWYAPATVSLDQLRTWAVAAAQH